MVLLIIIAIICIAYFIIENKYFKSENFAKISTDLEDDIKNIKDFNTYISSLLNTFKNIKRNEYGQASAKNICDCSLTVLRNAKNSPFPYICKYFNITKTEETLNDFEQLLNQMLTAEAGLNNLLTLTTQLKTFIKSKIPWYILPSRALKQLKIPTLNNTNINYPTYTFNYKSPSGKKTDSFTIIFDGDTVEKFVQFLSSEIKTKKSAQHQRSLMTKKLREDIKSRDNYTCKLCGNSTFNEPNLLLEIDHIIPVSKGGLTTPDNLQTLCWKCNRSKGNK